MRSVCYIILLLSQILLCGCVSNVDSSAKENEGAKQILQGIWISEDEETPSFMAKGDTIFTPTRQVCQLNFGCTMIVFIYKVIKLSIIR